MTATDPASRLRGIRARGRALVPLLIGLLLGASSRAEDATMAAIFARHGVQGTAVLAALDTGQVRIHNDARAAQRFPVASTFKILNTLIALDAGVVSGTGEVFVWNGQHHPIPDWNRNQTLESAFRVSCVWCYQQLAERIGAERYRTLLRQLGYGALREPFTLTTFWLDGALTISAVEQVDFLRRLWRHELPFSAAADAALRAIMLRERTPGFALYAKTGWAARVTPGIGWYVGAIETARETWLFATNLDVRNQEELPLRETVTRAILRDQGLIDSD